MKKTFLFFLCSLILLSPGAWAQKGRAIVAVKAVKPLKPLSNQMIEKLYASGRSNLVIQRALGVAAQRQAPGLAVVNGGEVNRALLEQLWKKSIQEKYRQEEGNMLGMNAWLIVIAHRIREGVKLGSPSLKILEEQLAFAQQDAEEEFKKRYQYSVTSPQFEKNPAYLNILGEAVAYRLSQNFLPTLASADQVRLLKVLMRGLFSGPVDWRELHTATLYREVREALKARGRFIKPVTLYGKMKEDMLECANSAAAEAAENGVVSLKDVRRIFIEDLLDSSKKFVIDGEVSEEWKNLIQFFQQKQQEKNPSR